MRPRFSAWGRSSIGARRGRDFSHPVWRVQRRPGALPDGYRAIPRRRCLTSGPLMLRRSRGCPRRSGGSAERALRLEPDNRKLVNDLGWCLFEAGRLEEAVKMLEQAVSKDPSDELARENLRFCKATAAKPRKKTRRSRGVAVNIQTESSGA